ncbi:MAG: amidohydrolase family protein, partial [Hyphococcus sp.]
MRWLKSFFKLTAVAMSMSPAVANDLLIDNITLIDGTGASPKAGVSVLIDDGRIVQIIGASDAQPEAANRIDGAGKYLIPGLIDTHIHLRGGRDYAQGDRRERNASFEQGKAALASYLYSGVTSIYDAGNTPDYILKLRADERAG